MAKTGYLQLTHDSAPGDMKAVNDHCAEVLVLFDKVEYFTGARIDGKENKRKTGDG